MVLNQLSKAIDVQKPIEIIQSKYETFNQRTNDLQEKHASYLSEAYDDDTEPTEVDCQWLENIETQVDLMESKYNQYIKANPTIAQAEISTAATTTTTTAAATEPLSKSDLKMAAKTCQYESTTLDAMINNLRISVACDKATVETIKDAQSDVRAQIDKYRAAQREYVLLLSDDEQLSQETERMRQMEAMCANENLKAGMAIRMRQTPPKPTEDKSSKSAGLQMKLERMKLPTFDGLIREYPRFKADFSKHVMPMLKSDESASYVLKSCLSKEPLEVVKNVDDDLQAMWDRLESKYGRSSLLIAEIMKEIKKLNSIKDGDNKGFIKLVNTIEGCYRDLVRINKESEICNSTIVSLIEEKLPPVICNMWSLEVSDQNTKIDDSNLFPSLLEFLLKHRRAIEYRSSDLRTARVSFATTESVKHAVKKEDIVSTPTVAPADISKEERSGGCWLHATTLHDLSECRLWLSMTPEDRWDITTDYRVCWCCLKTGHRQAFCHRLRTFVLMDAKNTIAPFYI